MGNINETEKTITLKEWDRSFSLTLENRYGRLPELTFRVERAILDDKGNFSSVPNGQIKVKYEANKWIPMVNPVTDVRTGLDVSQSYLMEILYSLFKDEMSRR